MELVASFHLFVNKYHWTTHNNSCWFVYFRSQRYLQDSPVLAEELPKFGPFLVPWEFLLPAVPIITSPFAPNVTSMQHLGVYDMIYHENICHA